MRLNRLAYPAVSASEKIAINALFHHLSAIFRSIQTSAIFFPISYAKRVDRFQFEPSGYGRARPIDPSPNNLLIPIFPAWPYDLKTNHAPLPDGHNKDRSPQAVAQQTLCLPKKLVKVQNIRERHLVALQG